MITVLLHMTVKAEREEAFREMASRLTQTTTPRIRGALPMPSTAGPTIETRQCCTNSGRTRMR